MLFKKLFYASASILMLALAYHLGATTAGAQAPDNSVVAVSNWGSNAMIAVTANGDVYFGPPNGQAGAWTAVSNIFGNTPTQQSSWGALKVQSR